MALPSHNSNRRLHRSVVVFVVAGVLAAGYLAALTIGTLTILTGWSTCSSASQNVADTETLEDGTEVRLGSAQHPYPLGTAIICSTAFGPTWVVSVNGSASESNAETYPVSISNYGPKPASIDGSVIFTMITANGSRIPETVSSAANQAGFAIYPKIAPNTTATGEVTFQAARAQLDPGVIELALRPFGDTVYIRAT